jgi:branched-chain amino acid transport system ATP-binding protein
VEDNIYLAALGIRTGHTFPFRSNKRDGPLREKARAAAREVGLERRLDALVSELSHGERRQLAIGMARVAEPRLMMLDEPAAGLSRAERVTLTDLLLALPADVTLLLIEHDMDVAFEIVDTITVLHFGCVVADGPKETVRANPSVQEIYLGSEAAGDGPMH